MYDPHNDDPSEFEYNIYDDEYEEYDEYYYEEDPVYAEYDLYDAPPNARLDDYPAGIIYVDEDAEPEDAYEEDFYAQERFWTQRRIIIAVIVVLMVLSLLAPQLLQMIQIANDANTFAPIGPTPTALPSV